MNGTIDTLPAGFKANVKLRTDHEAIATSISSWRRAVTQNDSSNGKFKVTMDRTITGTISGGGTKPFRLWHDLLRRRSRNSGRLFNLPETRKREISAEKTRSTAALSYSGAAQPVTMVVFITLYIVSAL